MSEEKYEKPLSLKNKFDSKALILDLFSNIADVANNSEINLTSKVQPAFITNFGVIQGDIVREGDEKTPHVTDNGALIGLMCASLDTVLNIRNRDLTELEQEVGAGNVQVTNSSFFVLKNAIITPYANPQNKFNIGEMVLFSDQIVGITVGNMTELR